MNDEQTQDLKEIQKSLEFLRKANGRLLETLADFKQRIDDLEKRVKWIEKEIEYLSSDLSDFSDFRFDVLGVGEYKYQNCINKDKNGECTIWRRGEKPLTSKAVCAICYYFRER